MIAAGPRMDAKICRDVMGLPRSTVAKRARAGRLPKYSTSQRWSNELLWHFRHAGPKLRRRFNKALAEYFPDGTVARGEWETVAAVCACPINVCDAAIRAVAAGKAAK